MDTTKEFLEQIVGYDYLLSPPRDPTGPRLATVTPINKETPKPSFMPFKYHWLHGASYDDFLFHDHYVWHSARPRPKQATIEFRAACQQPLDDQQVVAALSLGIVENHSQVYDYLCTLARKPSGAKFTGDSQSGIRMEGGGVIVYTFCVLIFCVLIYTMHFFCLHQRFTHYEASMA